MTRAAWCLWTMQGTAPKNVAVGQRHTCMMRSIFWPSQRCSINTAWQQEIHH